MLTTLPRRRSKVLIVDDSPLILSMTKAVLERVGLAVVTLDSPIGCTRALSEERPDLALIDVAMPALRGDQLVELVRRRLPNSCPIVLFSERPEEELAQLMVQCGATGYIRKTDDWPGMTSLILTFLERAH